MPTPSTSAAPNGYQTAANVTPSDTVDLPVQATAIYVATAAGNVSWIGIDGVTVSIVGAAVGLIPVRVARVRSTGTTATVLALY